MSRQGPLLASLALLANAFVWGVSWWPFRQLESHGLHPLWATALIYVFALACLLAMRPGAWRAFFQHPLLWLLALASGLTNVGFNWAVTVGDVVRVVLLFYLMPMWTVLLSWPLLGEAPRLASVLRVALALAGVGVVLGAGQSGWPWPDSQADWLALIGGFSFSLTNILLLKLNRTAPQARMLAMFGGGALMATALAAWGTAQGWVGAVPAWSLSWGLIAAGLCLAFLVGNMALQYGAARLPAHTTAIIMLSEVLFATISSVALGAGTLTTQTLAGGALILLAGILATRNASFEG